MLSAFTHLNPRALLTKDAPDGLYCLDNIEDCRSKIGILRGKFNADDKDTLALRDFMRDGEKVPKTKFMGNFVHRKQTTFGARYNFGQQNSHHDMNEDTPKAVKIALDMARKFAEENELDATKYNGVHVNYYPFGKAGVQPHTDAEDSLDLSMPIISITLLAGSKIPRNFSIYEKPIGTTKLTKIADIELRHGDVVIMAGEMQEHFLHGIEKTAKKAFEDAERLNLTIRAFKRHFEPEKRQKCS
tara:strand:- start:1191 stop:1922 length:732 start_codon:yes stop_codon:yes gene_type:complete